MTQNDQLQNTTFKFFRFFETISGKIYGKSWNLDNFVFLLPSPPLNNVEKEGAKVASSYVMDSQHCIGEEGGFLKTLFKITIIFCH